MTKILAALPKKFPTDWRMRREYRLPDNNPKQTYYISWSPQAQGWTSASRDANGVILLAGTYHPINIAQYGLYEYEQAVGGNASSFQRWLAQATFLATHQEPDGSYRYANPLPTFSAGAGWISAMAQGEACSLLVRAFAATGDDQFAAAAVRAAKPLRRDVRSGGASYIRGDDVFFEEVAVEKSCHILNGHLFTAFGLWDMALAGLADRELIDLHMRAIGTLESWLPQFDAAGWSYYQLGADRHGNKEYSLLEYHQYHIAQLRVYSEMTNRARFRAMADAWQAALDDHSVRRRVWNYGLYRIAYRMLERVLLRKNIAWQPTNPIEVTT